MEIIRVIIVGGEINSAGVPLALKILQTAGVFNDIGKVEAVVLKHSDELNWCDPVQILDRCLSPNWSDKILIVLDVDNIQKTSLFLKEQVVGKTIVLTGPSSQNGLPLALAFNVGNAFYAAQTLPAGMYVSTHGYTELVHFHQPEKVFARIGRFGAVLVRCRDSACYEYLNGAPVITSDKAPLGIDIVAIDEIPKTLARTLKDLVQLVS